MSWPRSARASRTTPRLRRRARFRCRWRTMPRTASSRRLRTITFRNVIREGKKSKEKVDVFSFELLAYREMVNPRAMPELSQNPAEKLPEYFISADDIGPKEHVDIQAAAQLWVDSSISKTANVPTDYKYEDFKDIYMHAFDAGLKGCTTFRFNPEAFQGVLVKEDDLKNTIYVFTLGGWHGGRGAGRSGDRIRRRDAYRRESLRRAERRLLREILIWLTSKSGKKIAKYRVQKPEPKDAPAGGRGEGTGRRPKTTSSGCTRSSSVRSIDRLDLQDQDAGVRSRDVRDHQRHRAQRGHSARAAAAVRGVHQHEEPRSFPVDRRA
jgi:hypothetical protein